MSSSSRGNEDRLFVRGGRRHYRREYSLTEVRIGLVVLLLLALLITWIAWRGAHPDPELFRTDTELLGGGSAPAAFAGFPLAG